MYPFPIHSHGDKAKCLHEVQAGDNTWFVPAETPIAFVYNRQNYAVMMATADDLAEFAVGFSLSEAIIKSLDEIKSLELIMSEKGVDIRFKISLQAYERLEITLRRRNRIGSASCGLCGLENADILFKKLPQVSDRPIYLPDESTRKALNGFSAFQPLNQKTRSVHGAAWASLDGSIHFAFEDVGRHNAMA